MTVSYTTTAEWRELLPLDPGATFFQTPEWFDVWHHYAGFSVSVMRFSWPDGTVALLPLAIEKKYGGLRVWHHSSPASTYGGVIAKHQLADDQLSEIGDRLKRSGNFILRQNPYSKNPVLIGGQNPDFTQAMDLRSGSVEQVLTAWTRKHVRYLNQAFKQGFEVRQAIGAKDWDAFYDVYLKSVKRWNRSDTIVVSRDFYAMVQKVCGQEAAKLWLLLKDGVCIAGDLCFYHHRYVVSWRSATDELWFKQHPVHYLIYRIMEDAVHGGYDYFDRNPSGGLTGVAHFKKQLGCENRPADIFIQKNRILF